MSIYFLASTGFTHWVILRTRSKHWQLAWGLHPTHLRRPDMLSVAERRRRLSPFAATARPCHKAGLLQAVQTCAGTGGAAAFALASRAASGPLGRVQLRNLG